MKKLPLQVIHLYQNSSRGCAPKMHFFIVAFLSPKVGSTMAWMFFVCVQIFVKKFNPLPLVLAYNYLATSDSPIYKVCT